MSAPYLPTQLSYMNSVAMNPTPLSTMTSIPPYPPLYMSSYPHTAGTAVLVTLPMYPPEYICDTRWYIVLMHRGGTGSAWGRVGARRRGWRLGLGRGCWCWTRCRRGARRAHREQCEHRKQPQQRQHVQHHGGPQRRGTARQQPQNQLEKYQLYVN
jgi:hypothetical protein